MICPDPDHLDVRDDAVLGAEIEHLLRLGDAADQRAGELAALEDEARQMATGMGFSGAPTRVIVPSRFNRSDERLEIVRRRDGVENEVEAVRVRRHLVRIF